MPHSAKPPELKVSLASARFPPKRLAHWGKFSYSHASSSYPPSFPVSHCTCHLPLPLFPSAGGSSSWCVSLFSSVPTALSPAFYDTALSLPPFTLYLSIVLSSFLKKQKKRAGGLSERVYFKQDLTRVEHEDCSEKAYEKAQK